MRALAYLSGVVHGDGWLGKTFGLRVADREFAQTFSDAVFEAFGVRFAVVTERRTDGTFFKVGTSHAVDRFAAICDFLPDDNEDRAVWLRGMFDSEGTVMCAKIGNGYVHRKIAFYATDERLLATVTRFLGVLDIPSVTRRVKKGAGHKGNQPVFELCVTGGRPSLVRFAAIIGSSISQKRTRLDQIASSYAPPSAFARGQRLGVATKNRRRNEDVRPRVLAAMRSRVAAGEPITLRACERAIPGYATMRKYHRHHELCEMANASA